MKPIIIKLGGSLVSPNRETLFDFSYLSRLRSSIYPFIEKGYKFFFILGGGSLMRMYRDLAKQAGINDEEGLHWIGTTVNVLNAEVVRVYFAELADPGVFKYEDYYTDTPLEITKSIKVGGGGRPGHSGDMDATLAALKCQADTIINLKNVDYIYTKDPKIDNTAEIIKDITWTDYLNLIGNPTEHDPGASFPIDPIASRKAMENNLKMIVASGWDLENFVNILDNREYKGSLVHN